MQSVYSFAPISNPSASILILGSMPGVASLKAHQYYAHPRNAFWPIMGDLFNFDANEPYTTRTQALKNANVALWDVLKECERPGSLDSSIKNGSRVANDFVAFFKQHTHIRLIAFNGAEAEKSFRKYVPAIEDFPNTHIVRLPSTSPAHTMPLKQKMTAWRDITNFK